MKWLSSLRVRLVGLVLLAAVPAFLLTIYSGLERRDRAAARVQSDVLRLAQLATINQETFIENTRVFLVALSHTPAVRSADLTECQELFGHLFLEHYPEFASFYVADLNYNIVCTAPGTHVTSQLRQCEHYAMMITNQEFLVSNYHICKESGRAIMAMGYPVYDYQGNFFRVINISIDLSWLNEVASQFELPAGSTLDVLDDEGYYLTHYPEPEAWIGKSLTEDSPFYPLFNKEQGLLVAQGADGIERIYATTPMESARGSVKVIMGVPTETAFAESNRVTTRNLLLLGSATILAAVAAFLLSELLVMRQTRALLNTTAALAAGDLSARTSIPHNAGELGQLASAFDQMASSLEQREQERQRDERAIREYASELERSNRELQDFANIASHDMQEPLRKILTFSELLNQRYDGIIDERGRDYMERMEQAARRLYDLINELLAYSRITTRAHPFEPVDLNEVTRRVLSDLDLQIEGTGAKVEVATLPTIEADPTQMYQLIMNLVSNALKFQDPGSRPQVKIHASTASAARGEANGWVQLSVSDNGIGFDEKYLDRIFQPFQRLNPLGTYEGTGMGLAICRKIIERHGGSISARSKPGSGTTFLIDLPARQNNGEDKP